MRHATPFKADIPLPRISHVRIVMDLNYHDADLIYRDTNFTEVYK